MTDDGKCPKCNSSLSVQQTGHVYAVHCEKCDWESGGTFYPGDDIAFDKSPQYFAVRIHGREGPISIVEICAIRKIVPAFRECAISRLLNTMKGRKEFDLGSFPHHKALKLQAAAQEHGLILSLKPTNSDNTSSGPAPGTAK
jgi:hypothetical protein